MLVPGSSHAWCRASYKFLFYPLKLVWVEFLLLAAEFWVMRSWSWSESQESFSLHWQSLGNHQRAPGTWAIIGMILIIHTSGYLLCRLGGELGKSLTVSGSYQQIRVPSTEVLGISLGFCRLLCALEFSPHWASLVAQMLKNLPAMQETWVWYLDWEDPLEKGMATHSSILAWRIPWSEKPGGLQFMRSQSRTQLSY